MTTIRENVKNALHHCNNASVNWIALLLLLVLCFSPLFTHSFVFTANIRHHPSISELSSSFVAGSRVARRRKGTILHGSNYDDDTTSSKNDNHDKVVGDENWIQKRKTDYVELLDRIDMIESTIQQTASIDLQAAATDDVDGDDVERRMIDELNIVALKQVQDEYNAIKSRLIPPDGLSMEDYQRAIKTVLCLSPPIRIALFEAIGVEEFDHTNTKTSSDVNGLSRDVLRIPELVCKLYEQRMILTPQRLTDAYRFATSDAIATARRTPSSISDAGAAISGQLNNADTERKNNNPEDILAQFLDGKTTEETQLENSITQLISRVTRKEDKEVTIDEANVVMNTLIEDGSSSPFIPNGRPEKIPGGYIIRGRKGRSKNTGNEALSGMECINAIDQKLPLNWNCSVSLMPDITDLTAAGLGIEENEDTMNANNKILILLRKDFSPNINENFFRLTTLLAIISILLFSVAIYGSNDIFANELISSLSPSSSPGGNVVGVGTNIVDGTGLAKTTIDSDSLIAAFNLINTKIGDVLVPILIVTGAHEFGHWLVARREKLETSTTLLPLFGSLPTLSPLTRLRSSPPSLTALFDFAFAGPMFGFIASFCLLGYGLFETQGILAADVVATGSGGDFGAAAISAAATTTKSARDVLPALPVSFFKMSTLGAAVVEYATGGYNTLAQDPQTPIPLHPFAIAGYCGMLANALEMLPLGSTDGGRISLSIFGRQGHSIFGGATWLVILVSTFFALDQRGDTLLAAWLVFNVVQNDMEIPARDETDKVDVPRCAAAFLIWFLSLLVLVPMS